MEIDFFIKVLKKLVNQIIAANILNVSEKNVKFSDVAQKLITTHFCASYFFL